MKSNSLAVRLQEPKFMDAFNSLFEEFGAEQVFTLMSDGLAVGLQEPKFMEAFNSLFEKFSRWLRYQPATLWKKW